MSPALSIDPTEHKTATRWPVFTVAAAAFAAGIALGLGSAMARGGERIGGLLLLGSLCLVPALLYWVAEKSRRRIHADEISYRAFFDQAVDGIFRTTPEGHYSAVNQALAGIYGYPSPQALIAGLTDIGSQLYVEPERRAEFHAHLRAHDTVTGFVSEIFQRSGKRIWISENARAVRDRSGTLLCYEGTVEDVTEKFEQEQVLRIALRQAEIANKMKTAFLAAMSHELKTPLNAVLGFSEIIRDEVLGPVGSAAYREYAGDIHTSGARLLAVINDVLDVSRLEGGLLTIEARPESVHDIVARAIRLARGITRDNRKIAVQVPSAIPLLHVDPQRMAQAIGNMLANALKFTPADGTVRVAAHLEQDGAMTLVVEDTGIGMAQQTIAAALEPFRQIDGALSRRFEGAGLGLSIAKALIELHGGHVEVVSAIGVGTTVTLRLPAKCTMRLQAAG